VLLLLLLVTASGLGWRWWHHQSLNNDATSPQLSTITSTESTQGTQDNHPNHSAASGAATSPLSTTSGASLRPGAGVASAEGTASTAASTSQETEATKAKITPDNQLAKTPSPIARVTTDAKPTLAAAPAGMLADGSKPVAGRLRKRLTHEAAAGAATAATSGTAARAAQASSLGPYPTGREVALNASKHSSIASAQAKARKEFSTKKSASRRAHAASFAANSVSGQSVESQSSTQLGADDAAGRSAAAQAQLHANQPNTALTTKPNVLTSGAATPGTDASAVLVATGLPQLQARTVALQLLAASPLAQPQPTAITPNKPSAIPLPRWAVQVLAGPALTYRHLSSSSALYANTTPAGIPIIYPGQYSQATANVAELERPALGGGFQLTVRRSLAERWSLSAGLGYAEFATRLALQQVHSASNRFTPGQDSSTTSIHRRDTYRFATVPLRVGYTKPLTPRWSVGLLAGADVALYVGGSSTEGSTCACQTQSWGLTGSPYRRVSVGASLGAEVRYRLNGRWELLAQPTATYMLNPLAQATSAYYRRHLLGGTALLGAAYTLP
jgi:hypothetical protein